VIGLAIQAFANPHPVTVNTSLLLPPGASRDGTMSAMASSPSPGTNGIPGGGIADQQPVSGPVLHDHWIWRRERWKSAAALHRPDLCADAIQSDHAKPGAGELADQYRPGRLPAPRPQWSGG